MTDHLKVDWVCGGCGYPSHEPAKDELITCENCGINGVVTVEQWDKSWKEWMEYRCAVGTGFMKVEYDR